MSLKTTNTQTLSTRKILALVLSVVALACAVLSVIGIVSGAGISPAQAKEGVVYIENYLFSANGQMVAASSGTGWAIGKKGEPVEYIVTNGHVVEYAYVYPKEEPGNYMGEIRVYFSAAENDYVIPQVVFYSDSASKDLAILKLPSATTKRVPLVLRDSNTVEQGEQVYAIGYPGKSNVVQDYTRYDASDATVTSGVISKRVTIVGAEYPAFQTDTAVNPGNSGGPLVDKNGFVVGVNSSGLMATLGESSTIEQGINYSSEINQLIRVLDIEGLPYAIKGANNWMIFVFAPLFVLALAAAILLFVLGRNSGKAKTNTNPHSGPVVPNQKPCLRGISGQYAGEKFNLSASIHLTLGRDSKRCNIVFGANAPGISSCHCTVYFDENAGCFILVDNGSSYGTFLTNGKKLAATVPERLNTGDGFYLADGANRFVVTKE